MATSFTSLRRGRCIALLVLCLHTLFSSAQGDLCNNPLQAAFCPIQIFDLYDSVYTNDVTNYGVAGMSLAKGKDIFLELSFPNDTAIERQIRCNLNAVTLSRPTTVYFLWFEDTCNAAPVEVDSFPISSVVGIGNQVCFTRIIGNLNAPAQRLALDFSDSLKFEVILSLGYTALHADTACEDSILVSKGAIELDNSMCGDSLHLPYDSSMVYLPGNMPFTIYMNDEAPNNNGYLVSIKKVDANLGIFNHPFENSNRFSIDTQNQNYCDIIVTMFLKNTTGHEAINGARLQLDNNFDVVGPVTRYGAFYMPEGPGYHNPNGQWSAVYNPPGHEIIWEFDSPDGRGDIDNYGNYGCRVYHFGFRAKVSLTGAPFNLHFSMQGDGWGDSTLMPGQVCGPRKTGCSFKCRCRCMCRPGQFNFLTVNGPPLVFDIEGGGCMNNVGGDMMDMGCSADTMNCIDVGSNFPVMLYEGFSGYYKIADPVNNFICPDSCRGHITTIDSLACTQDLYFSRVRSISTLSAYDGMEYFLCPGDTIVLTETAAGGICNANCVSCFSNLVDSNDAPVTYSNGNYFITQAGTYFDKHGVVGMPCVTIHVHSTDVDVDVSPGNSNCVETCQNINVTGDSSLTYAWLLPDGSSIGSGPGVAYCHSDTVSVQLVATATGGCSFRRSVFLAMDSVMSPNIYLDTIIPVPCGIGAGFINVHTLASGTQFVWSDSSSAQSLSTVTPGTYTVIATNGAGCSDSATFSIGQVAPFTASITTTEDSVCLGASATLCASPAGSYVWSNGETTACPSVIVGDTSAYSVTVTDNTGCSASSSYAFAFIDELQLNASVTDVPCFTFYSSGQIDLTVSNGISAYHYIWSNGSPQQDLEGLTPGVYQVTVTDAMFCTASAAYEVIYLDLFHITAFPHLDTITLGEKIALTVTTTGSPLTHYQWTPASYLDCDTCADLMAEPPVSMMWYVTGTDTNQCQETDSVKIIVIDDHRLFMPNVFSPNGDGNNDVWHVFGNTDAIKKFGLMVFNRWGEKVFESSDYGLAWNGTYRGEELIPQVFVYTMKVSWKDGHFDSDYHGSVTLFR